MITSRRGIEVDGKEALFNIPGSTAKRLVAALPGENDKGRTVGWNRMQLRLEDPCRRHAAMKKIGCAREH